MVSKKVLYNKGRIKIKNFFKRGEKNKEKHIMWQRKLSDSLGQFVSKQ